LSARAQEALTLSFRNPKYQALAMLLHSGKPIKVEDLKDARGWANTLNVQLKNVKCPEKLKEVQGLKRRLAEAITDANKRQRAARKDRAQQVGTCLNH
jgi:hypothetical protein